MPIPRFQPARNKRLKTTGQPSVATAGPSLIDSLDDYCLSKIIGYALENVSSSDDRHHNHHHRNTNDTRIYERNLSLVSRRWYWLTQAQVGTCGVHRINLDKIPRGESTMKGFNHHHRIANNNNNSNIDLFRILHPRLLKYKNIHLEGSLTCSEFRKLILAFDAARIESLSLKLDIERDGTLAKDFAILPKQLAHLRELTLSWLNDARQDYSNGLTWTIYTRAINLRMLEINLIEEQFSQETIPNGCEATISATQQNYSRGDSVCKISSLFSSPSPPPPSQSLERLIFNRSSNESPPACSFISLVRSTLSREYGLHGVETNDAAIIEYLIRSSDRICTARELRSLKFSSPIKNIDLLNELISSKTLGTNYLAIVMDNVDLIDEIRQSMQVFHQMRQQNSVCQLSLHLRDQKFSDCEDKIKHLVHLSRLAKVLIYINVQQRVSIDCCHLMWSIGRALQSSEIPGECLFKVSINGGIQATGCGGGGGSGKQQANNNFSEISIPFGGGGCHKINPNTEDVMRHREIMKAVKRNCYNSFVKSVRDNVLMTR